MSVRFQINPTHLEKPYFLRPKNIKGIKFLTIFFYFFYPFLSFFQLFLEIKQSMVSRKNSFFFQLTFLKSFRFFLGNPGVFTITSCKLGVDLEMNFLTLRKLFLQLIFLVIVALVYSAIISWELDLILPIFALFLG